ncbi:NmrA-like family protein [Mycena rebaudengoi]|nr:NmrA-like family protein [Mycena rebaudengoi]
MNEETCTSFSEVNIMGASSGLGAAVLAHLKATLPSGDTLIASSSNPTKESLFTTRGIAFRHADYDDTASLASAFSGVDKLLFVSSPTFDNAKRLLQHQCVVDAAAAARVGHVYYTSLAFGGLGDGSAVAVQAAHLETERMLARSGVVAYTSVREGIYANAFPLFINWFPESDEVVFPGTGTDEGGIALALREELGEATANVMRGGRWDDQTKILLSGSEVMSLREVVGIINETTGRDVKVRLVDAEEYVREGVRGPGRAKGEVFFRSRISWFEGLVKGEGAHVTGTLKEALGREPTGGREALRGLLRETGGNYTWHQNEVGRSKDGVKG